MNQVRLHRHVTAGAPCTGRARQQKNMPDKTPAPTFLLPHTLRVRLGRGVCVLQRQVF